MNPPQDNLKKEIKCYKCKKYFNSVIIFTENQEEDYKQEKWFCANCFNKECFDKGYSLAKSETLKKVFKIIDDFWFSDDKFISVDKLGFLIFKEKEMKEELTQKLKELETEK